MRTFILLLILFSASHLHAEYYRVFYRVDYDDQKLGGKVEKTTAKASFATLEEAQAFVIKSAQEDKGSVLVGSKEERRYEPVIVAPGESFDPVKFFK